MTSASSPPRRTGELSLNSETAARLVIACVPVFAIFSFGWQNVADAAIIALVLIAIPTLVRDRTMVQRAPILLSLIWMVFVAAAASHATLSDLPGHHFRSWPKHIPIALGPLIAVSLAAACQRLRLTTDVLVALFLAGLLAGTLLMLARHDAIGQLARGWPDPGSPLFGTVNRNYAALSCGLSLIASLSLLSYLLFEVRVRSLWATAAMLGLILLLIGSSILLARLPSRAAYAATALALAAWFFAVAARAQPPGEARSARLARLVVTVLAIGAVAVAGHYSFGMSGREVVRGSLSDNLLIVGQIFAGNPGAISAPLQGAEERLQLLALGVDLLRQRPLLGWGPDASLLPGLFSPFPFVKTLNQFHNGYLQHLVSFGLAGAGLMAALLIALVRSALQMRANAPHRMAPPLFAASIALLVFLLAFNVGESGLLVRPAAAIATFLAALACMPPTARPSGT